MNLRYVFVILAVLVMGLLVGVRAPVSIEANRSANASGGVQAVVPEDSHPESDADRASARSESRDPASQGRDEVDVGPDPALVPAIQVERTARTVGEAVDLLLERARSGEAAAVAALGRLIGRCLGSVDDFSRSMENVPLGQDVRHMQQHAIQRSQRFCDLAQDSVRALGAELLEIERKLRDQGDVWALARHFSTPAGRHDDLGLATEEVAQLAYEAIQASRDPYLIESGLRLLFGRYEAGSTIPSIAAARAELSADPRLALTPPLRVQQIQSLAIELMACEFGLPCSARGPRQDYYCMAQANCAPDLPFGEFVRQRLLTPAEYEAMLRFLGALREIARGG
jgi:hypothetical protein